MTRLSTKALVFDLGKVIVDFNVDRACEQAAVITGTSAQHIMAFLYQSGLEHRFESGDLDFEQLHQLFQKEMGREIPLAQLQFACASIFSPIQESIELLRFLSDSEQVPMILLSNTNHVHWDYICDHYRIHEFFDAHILSFRERAMKPDQKIYRAAIAAAGCSPEECFFTDDLAVNVDGARAVGMDAVLFTSVAQLRTDLQKRNIKVC